MSHYPKHPRPVVSKESGWASALVERACEEAKNQPARTHSSLTPKPPVVSLLSCLQSHYGQLWQLSGYGHELCQWEMGQRNRRPNSRQINNFRAETKVRVSDEAHEFLCHWVALVEVAKSRGVSPQPVSWRDGVFGDLPVDLVAELNAGELPEGVVYSPGGPDLNRRPPEERPPLGAAFDGELAGRLAEVCDKQRRMPVVDGRTVEDCLYLPLTDVLLHLEGYGAMDYVMKRIEWLVGKLQRRPQWGGHDDRARMRGLDDLAFRLACHWLALHEALSPDGSVDVTDAARLLLDPSERLLLTDVASVCDESHWQATRDSRAALRESLKSQARTRLSMLAERRVA